jgi:hypothetical protein
MATKKQPVKEKGANMRRAKPAKKVAAKKKSPNMRPT